MPPAVSLDFANTIGIPGYPNAGGEVYSELHTELSGRRGPIIYREMWRYHPTVARWYSLVSSLVVGAAWNLAPADPENPAAVELRDFVDTCTKDMRMQGNPQPWSAVLQGFCTALPFGWALQEVTYKRRETGKSDYPDNRIGWASIDLRAQLTKLRWDLGVNSEINGFFQLAPMDGQIRYIPAEKFLLYRPQDDNGSPEGLSFLSAAFEAWRDQRRYKKINGIGMERYLAGFPVIRVPAEVLNGATGSNEAAVRDRYAIIGARIRKDEQGFIMLPSDVHPNTQVPMYALELLSANGDKPPDILPIINNCDRDIATALWVQFLLLGQQKSGTQALSVDQTDLFAKGIDGLNDGIAEVFQDAVRDLCEMNGEPAELHPRVTHSKIEGPGLAQIAAFIRDTAMDTTDPEMQAWLRQQINAPAADPTGRAL